MISRIVKVIIFCGLVACLYAMIFQMAFFLNSIKFIDVERNSWNYNSFMGQRNVFAGYCYLCAISCMLFFNKKKYLKNIYVYLYVFFGVQIFATSSRTAMLSYFILTSFYVFLKSNKLIKCMIISIFIFAFYVIWNDEFGIRGYFFHSTSLGVDSSYIRFMMWKNIGRLYVNNGYFVFGLGGYSSGKLLMDEFGFSSSHNTYVDYFIEGGLVYLLFQLINYLKIFSILKKNKDSSYSIVMLCAYVSFLFYNISEAGFALFTQSFFSITTTILFVILPISYNNHLEEVVREHNC